MLLRSVQYLSLTVRSEWPGPGGVNCVKVMSNEPKDIHLHKDAPARRAVPRQSRLSELKYQKHLCDVNEDDQGVLCVM